MSARYFLPIVFIALSTLAVKTFADDEVECARYRVAGLPCPPRSNSPKAPDAARSSIRAPLVLRAPEVSARGAASSPARDAPGPTAPAAPRSHLSTSPAPPALVLQPAAPARISPGLPAASAMAALAAASLTTTMAAASDGQEPGQIVVYWASVEDANSTLATLARDRRIQSVSSARLEHLGGVIAVFQLTTSAEAVDFRAQLIRDFPGLLVDFNTRYRPLHQTKARPRIYLSQKIDQPKQGGRVLGVPPVRVGIVDGPVAPIAALAAIAVTRKNFLSASDTMAPAGHATAIAALISGSDIDAGFAGVASQSILYSAETMRAVGQEECTNSIALVRALDWLLGEKVQIINLSLGGPGDVVTEKAFIRLAEFPVVVVAAAGNGGPAAPPAYPAAYPGVIAVTATDAADRPYSAANRGAYITLAAPGVDLWVPDAASGRYVSGTSFSAAVVTAAGALLLERTPKLNAAAMARHLCRDAIDLGAPGIDPVFGCGLIQIGASLRDERS